MQSARKIAAGGIVPLGAKGSKSTRIGIVIKRRRLSTALKNFIVRKFICRFSVLIIYFSSQVLPSFGSMMRIEGGGSVANMKLSIVSYKRRKCVYVGSLESSQIGQSN